MRTLILSLAFLLLLSKCSAEFDFNDLAGQPAANPAWPIDMLTTFEFGTIGAIPDTNTLTASTFGYNGGSWSTSITNFGNPQIPLVTAVISGSNSPVGFNYSIGSTVYDGAGTRSLEWPLTASPWGSTWESCRYLMPIPNGVSNCTVSANIQYQSSGESDNDCIGITYYAGAWAIAEFHNDGLGNIYMVAHGQASGASTLGVPVYLVKNNVPLNGGTDTWYKVSVESDVARREAVVIVQVATNGQLVGYSRCKTDNDGDIYYFQLMSYLEYNGGNEKFDNFAVGFNNKATLPLGPITVPAPASLTASQTGVGTISLTWGPDICPRYTVSRFNVNSNSWTIVTNNNEGNSLVDSGLVTGNSYYYKVNGLVGANQSVDSTNSTPVLLAGASGGTGSFGSQLTTFNIFGGPNYTITLPAGVTSGQRAVVCVGGFNQGYTITGVTDTKGNTYTVRTSSQPITGTGLAVGMADAYIATALSSSDTITFTLSAADTGNYVAGSVLLLNGTAASGQPDATTASGGDSSPASLPATTTSTVAVAVGIIGEYPNNALTSPWTLLSGIIPSYGSISVTPFYKNFSANGAQDPSITNSAGAWGACWTAYK